METPPQPELGDIAFTVAFDLAKHAKRAPRKIAEELASVLRDIEGVEKVEIAGAGYLNVFLDRGRYLEAFCREVQDEPPSDGKVIVEHTNINPNKAAHIGHLRNAALGDTFVRVLRYSRAAGRGSELHRRHRCPGGRCRRGVRRSREKGSRRDPSHCPNRRTSLKREPGRGSTTTAGTSMPESPNTLRRSPPGCLAGEATLKAIEAGELPEAAIAQEIATRIAACHLETMERMGVRYDLLPLGRRHSSLTLLDMAFELLKEKRAVRLAESGKNAGCWVMDLPEETDGGASDEKVIVRSNGTVTYVGKDIAYQLWKLASSISISDIAASHTYPEGSSAWSTTSKPSEPGAPAFGKGFRVYNVIDTRQSYLQKIVRHGVSLISSEETLHRSHHFSYEMVALTLPPVASLVSKSVRTTPASLTSRSRAVGGSASKLTT